MRIDDLPIRRVLLLVSTVPLVVAVVALVTLGGIASRDLAAAAAEVEDVDVLAAITDLHAAAGAELWAARLIADHPPPPGGDGERAARDAATVEALWTLLIAQTDAAAVAVDAAPLTPSERDAAARITTSVEAVRQARTDGAGLDQALRGQARQLSLSMAHIRADRVHGGDPRWFGLQVLQEAEVLAAAEVAGTIHRLAFGQFAAAGLPGRPGPAAPRPLLAPNDETQEAVQRAAAWTGGEPDAGPARPVRDEWRQLLEAAQSSGQAPYPAGPGSVQRLWETGHAHVERVDEQAATLASALLADSQQRAANSSAMRTTAIALTAALVALTTWVTRRIGRRVSARVGDVLTASSRVADGDFEQHGDPVRGRDEIGQVAAAVDATRHALHVAHAQLTALGAGELADPVLDDRSAGGLGDRLVQAVQDVKGAASALTERAHRDPLTGLLNREGLAAHELATGPRPSVAVVIDLDGFKPINDTHGHHAGDQILKHVAAVLHGAVRPVDLVARTGGDEFLLILDGAGEEVAVATCARIEEALQRPATVPSGDRDRAAELSIGASIGWALRDAQQPLDEAVAAADAAMYQAKHARPDDQRTPTRRPSVTAFEA